MTDEDKQVFKVSLLRCGFILDNEGYYHHPRSPFKMSQETAILFQFHLEEQQRMTCWDKLKRWLFG